MDVAICRIFLDDLTGYELIAEVSKEQPITALVISKFPLHLIRSVRGFDRSLPLMLEPFEPDEVAAKVVELLKRDGNDASTEAG